MTCNKPSSNYNNMAMMMRKPSSFAALLLLLASVHDSHSFATTTTRNAAPLSAFSRRSSTRLTPSQQHESYYYTTATATATAELNLFGGQCQPSAECSIDGSGGTSATSGDVNNRHSARDWLYNVKSLPRSSVLKETKHPVLAVFGWSCVVSVIHHTLLKSGLVSLASKMAISSVVHSFLVSSIGLLLVFRTNSAYQRFYEGRKIWENILSVSRNLSRLTQLYSRDIGADRKRRLRQLIAAYPYLLRHHIRSGCLCEGDSVDPKHRLLLEEPAMQVVDSRYEGDSSCGGTTQPMAATGTTRQCWVDRRNLPWRLFHPGALEKVARARNRPLWVCDRMGREICDIPYNGEQFTNRERQHFLSHVEKLTNAIGQCERIHQTAVPLNYARHSLRSLTLWLFTLPFAVVKDLGLATGPAVAIIAWLMFGVYQIGYSIEDPFQGSLRLSILCDAIRNDVMGMDDDDNADEGAHFDLGRDTAYCMEQQAWVDDAATNHLIPQPIPPQALPVNYLVENQNKSALFSRQQYEEVKP